MAANTALSANTKRPNANSGVPRISSPVIVHAMARPCGTPCEASQVPNGSTASASSRAHPCAAIRPASVRRSTTHASWLRETVDRCAVMFLRPPTLDRPPQHAAELEQGGREQHRIDKEQVHADV